jgi:hypothetical protein
MLAIDFKSFRIMGGYGMANAVAASLEAALPRPPRMSVIG